MASTPTRPDEHASEPESSALQRREHGEAVERFSNPDQRPGPDWGWHGRFPRGRQIAGWVSVGFLGGMVTIHFDGIGFEDVVLILLGAFLVVMLVRDARSQRHPS